MRLRTGRALTSLAVVCGLLAAGACSGEETPESVGGTVEPGPDAVAEAERLYLLVNESHAVSDELTMIEHRVTKRCMEDEGFSVHDPMEFQESHTAAYTAGGYLANAPLRAVPTAEAAEEWGFGVWAEFVRNPGNEDLAAELLTPEAMTAFGILDAEESGMDTSEWDAEDDGYHAEWIEAYSGSPAIMSDVKGAEIDPEAPPGGCWLKMVETMYGEPYMISYDEEEGGGESGEYAATHEPNPLFALEEIEDYGALLETVRDEADAFESCLIDHGYEGWELGESFYPPLWEYFGAMYDPAYFEEYGEEGLEVPDAPEEVPSDFMGVLELERAMAVDFAACGRESGLRTAVEEAWAAMLVEAYLPIETDLVAWRDAMQGHLDNAQDYLQA
ncbi:hypothetical protein [Glycomyces tritici]|uniref:Uncharacterized protein n=1 Tax=Glycomyces tritici TaxID=2665176 RepID=A0ABT7YT61_9ACTN|nr:hypothetical protein [Glycomyces tritici]MDN3241793.1 hypothetical protein [Glycomyces tritici]